MTVKVGFDHLLLLLLLFTLLKDGGQNRMLDEWFSMYKITTIFRRNFINIITHSVTCHQRKKTHRCRWWKFSVMLVDFSSGSQVSSNMAPAKSRLYHSAWNLMRSTRKNILTYHRQNILKLNTLKTIYLWGSVVLSYI